MLPPVFYYYFNHPFRLMEHAGFNKLTQALLVNFLTFYLSYVANNVSPTIIIRLLTFPSCIPGASGADSNTGLQSER